MEQQKEAFFRLQFDKLPFEEFVKSVSQFKSKVAAQFPPPEYIYKKRLQFLGCTIPIFQQQQQKQVVLRRSDKPSEGAVIYKKKEPSQDSAILKSSEKENLQDETNNSPIKKSKLGVKLLDHSASKAEESDDSIIIPDQIQDIIDKYKDGKDLEILTEEDLIDELSFSRKEHERMQQVCQWVEASVFNEAPINDMKDSGKSLNAYKFQVSQIIIAEIS